MKYLSFLMTVLLASTTFASYETYDEIVDKLSSYSNNNQVRTKTNYSSSPMRTFSTAHIGLGFTQTFYDADAVALDSRMQNQGGLILTLGIDMMNERWAIEGAYINFGRIQPAANTIRLREYVIRGLYKPSISKSWNARIGLGVSSRFLSIANAQINEEYRTPSALFLFGLESYMNQYVSFGADLSYKSAMIQDTIDTASVDLAFKIDAHF